MLKSISYIFHPLFMPLIGVLFYFSKSPRFIPLQLIQHKVIAIIILTVILPLLVGILLKKMGKIQSIHLETTKERILPLLVYCIIILVILKRVFTPFGFIEVYYFFVGVLASTLGCILANFVNFKASIHMLAISAILTFFIGLSIHFSINILGSIALVTFLTGAVATSRLYLKAHTVPELIIGSIIGIIPQLLFIPSWL